MCQVLSYLIATGALLIHSAAVHGTIDTPIAE
jgi:hypothetical protein